MNRKKILCVGTILLSATGCLGKQENPASIKPSAQKEEKQIKAQNNLLKKDKKAMHKTASGLQYTILKEAPANAPKVTKGQNVTVHYTGWLDNNGEEGKKFDSSVDRGTPFTFPLGAGYVIKGWDEGVEGMRFGEKRRFIIPSDLGYGSRGAGSSIPPYATLIFDVEVLSAK